MRVYKSDLPGDPCYYTKEDLEYHPDNLPSDQDPGVLIPKSGAIPRDRHGNKLDEE